MFHSTIKFIAEYSKEEVNFSDVNIKLVDGELKADLFVKPTDTHLLQREYLTVKLSGLTEYVQITRPLIDVVMI